MLYCICTNKLVPIIIKHWLLPSNWTKTITNAQETSVSFWKFSQCKRIWDLGSCRIAYISLFYVNILLIMSASYFNPSTILPQLILIFKSFHFIWEYYSDTRWEKQIVRCFSGLTGKDLVTEGLLKLKRKS